MKQIKMTTKPNTIKRTYYITKEQDAFIKKQAEKNAVVFQIKSGIESAMVRNFIQYFINNPSVSFFSYKLKE